ncbi:MAG: hypothetical protein ACREVX_16590 [Clostridium sp.]|uniref:hypothetical protein n=1 Tax=Clostridium sp. TaxID=1506 RepID=UPI003D6DA17B
MPNNDKVYEITITQEGLDTYRGTNISANTMGEYLGISSVMTDFEWDGDVNRDIILYAKVKDDITAEDALASLEDVEFIDRVDKSKEQNFI